MAEGTRLLSEYGDQYSIAGSNPALSVWEAPQIQGFGRFCMSSLADGPPPHSGMWKHLTRRHWRSIPLGFYLANRATAGADRPFSRAMAIPASAAG